MGGCLESIRCASSMHLPFLYPRQNIVNLLSVNDFYLLVPCAQILLRTEAGCLQTCWWRSMRTTSEMEIEHQLHCIFIDFAEVEGQQLAQLAIHVCLCAKSGEILASSSTTSTMVLALVLGRCWRDDAGGHCPSRARIPKCSRRCSTSSPRTNVPRPNAPFSLYFVHLFLV